jgi:hypothetical protein
MFCIQESTKEGARSGLTGCCCVQSSFDCSVVALICWGSSRGIIVGVSSLGYFILPLTHSAKMIEYYLCMKCFWALSSLFVHNVLEHNEEPYFNGMAQYEVTYLELLCFMTIWNIPPNLNVFSYSRIQFLFQLGLQTTQLMSGNAFENGS